MLWVSGRDNLDFPLIPVGKFEELVTQLVTLKSLGTAVDRLGSLEVFGEGWEKDCVTILKDLMGSGLMKDPKDSQFTWEKDENAFNDKIRDWDEDLNWFLQGHFDSEDLYQHKDVEDWEDRQFDGPENDVDDDNMAMEDCGMALWHDSGGSRTVCNYRCAKIARSDIITRRQLMKLFRERRLRSMLLIRERLSKLQLRR